MTQDNKCILCPNKAEHYLGYRDLKGKTAWYGDYCTSCLVKKLRGMVTVWNSKIKKYCLKCKTELKDKRFDKCDNCLGLVFNPKKESHH